MKVAHKWTTYVVEENDEVRRRSLCPCQVKTLSARIQFCDLIFADLGIDVTR